MNRKNTSVASEIRLRTVAPSMLKRKMLLTVSFLEGAAVMVVELLGAKIIAPFYGSSMYVWSSVLGVTLMALALGYYAGGRLSKKYNSDYPLYIILGVGAVFTVLAPQIAPAIMEATADLGVRMGSLIAVLGYLLPPIVCMGMVSPIITQQINNDSKSAGQSAGTVYAISTIGGILATFLAGFFLIPELGIRATAWLIGALLFAISLTGLLIHKKMLPMMVTSCICLLSFTMSPIQKNANPMVKVQYRSSGILGEWTVVDQVVAVQDGEQLSTRQLLLNGVDQTYTEVGNEPVSMWYYPHKLTALAGTKPEGSRALLLGMGGGSIAHGLIQLGFNLDIVELDERIPHIAQTYFGFDPATASLVIDDARHFIRHANEKYDLVVIDLLNGEVQPSHVFTQEGLTELRGVLQDDALLIVNFQGRFDLDNPALSVGPRSVFKTFESVGFKMLVNEQDIQEKDNLSADLLMYGTPKTFNFEMALQEDLRYNALFPFEKFSAKDYQSISGFDLNGAQLLTDDKPNLEVLNAPTILNWRQNKIDYTINGLLKKGLDIY